MSDPFRPETNYNVLREARIGLVVLAITLGVFSYVAYHRIVVSGTVLPEHVLNAPIAESVWPGQDAPEIARSRDGSDFQSTFGNMIAGARKSFGMDWERKSAARSAPPKLEFADPQTDGATGLASIPPIPRRREPPEFDLTSIQQHSLGKLEKTARAQFDSTKSSLPKLSLDVNELRPPEPKTSSVEPSKPSPADSLSPRRQRELKMATVTESSSNPSEFDNAFAATANPRSAAVTGDPTSLPDPKIQSAQPPPIRSAWQPGQFEPLNSIVPPVQNGSSEKQITADIAFGLKELQTPDAPPEIALSSYSGRIEKAPPRTNQEFDATRNNNTKEKDPATVASVSTEPPLEYTVRLGDSFWAIAQNIYDDGRFFRALYEYNQKRVGSFENLRAGTTIATPRKEELARLWPELCPQDDNSGAAVTDIDQRIYVTNAGDTLFEIARQRLGQASQYLEILKLNAATLDKNVTHLSPLPAGVRLILPYSDL